MVNEHYKNIRDGKLSDYIRAEEFRTVLPSQRTLVRGITELPVEIEFKRKNKKLLSFKVPWDGMIYGCVRNKNTIQKKLGLVREVKIISLTDWDDRFVLVFETENDKDTQAFYITTEEVVKLLENCRRAPDPQL